jgi:hypothetical protein
MRRLPILALALLTVVFAGCASYKLGPTNGDAAGDKSVQIVPFQNQTLEPHLTDAVTTELRDRLQRDATYKLSTHGDADIVVSGVITSYGRNAMSFQPGDTFTARDYKLALTAQVTARNRSTGAVIFEKPIKGFTTMRTCADLVSDERQALPLLAADLAKNIISQLADGSW